MEEKELEKKKVIELREMLRERDLPVSGPKKELIQVCIEISNINDKRLLVRSPSKKRKVIFQNKEEEKHTKKSESSDPNLNLVRNHETNLLITEVLFSIDSPRTLSIYFHSFKC